MRDQVTRFAGLSDLVLPSMDDEAAHFGDAGPGATIDRYLAAGAAQVVVKAGGGPVHYGGPAQGCVEGLERAVPVDTTAAGDSFNAGYLDALARGMPLHERLKHAVAVAGEVIAEFKVKSDVLFDEVRAGGLPLLLASQACHTMCISNGSGALLRDGHLRFAVTDCFVDWLGDAL